MLAYGFMNPYSAFRFSKDVNLAVACNRILCGSYNFFEIVLSMEESVYLAI